MSTYMKFVRKWSVRSSVALFTVAACQGYQVRQEYVRSKRLLPPAGPHSGIIEWKENVQDKLHTIKNKIITKKDTILHELDLEEEKLIKKIQSSVESWRQKAVNLKSIITDELRVKLSRQEKKEKRKIKLLLIGDSLACGVGCEGNGSNSPELPKMLAKILSVAFEREIQWFSTGLIGATANDIGVKLLPNKRQEILSTLFSNSDKELDKDCQLVVVVLCGLNDWRSSLESFPRCKGVGTFQNDLKGVIDEIKSIADTCKCEYRIFLPAIPINCIAKDPNCFFTYRPLKDLVEFIGWIWDRQKQAIARDDEHKKTWYIAAPMSESVGLNVEGFVSSDRVHPSNSGYQWWAMQMAEEIIPFLD